MKYLNSSKMDENISDHIIDNKEEIYILIKYSNPLYIKLEKYFEYNEHSDIEPSDYDIVMCWFSYDPQDEQIRYVYSNSWGVTDYIIM